MTSEPNSLDQFCINFANERLQNWIQRHLFEVHVNEYSAKGISHYVPSVSYFDNSECLKLLQNKPGGLIHIMDDQARRAPKKKNHTMVEAFQKQIIHPSRLGLLIDLGFLRLWSTISMGL